MQGVKNAAVLKIHIYNKVDFVIKSRLFLRFAKIINPNQKINLIFYQKRKVATFGSLKNYKYIFVGWDVTIYNKLYNNA